MASGFELFDHTADVGIRIWAPTMAGLIGPATDGLYAVIGEMQTRGSAEKLDWSFAGDDAAALLRDYLTEVLMLFENGHRVFQVRRVEFFDQKRLTILGEAREVDLERSAFCREVKAITYHELAIRAVEGGFEARVIVDI